MKIRDAGCKILCCIFPGTLINILYVICLVFSYTGAIWLSDCAYWMRCWIISRYSCANVIMVVWTCILEYGEYCLVIFGHIILLFSDPFIYIYVLIHFSSFLLLEGFGVSVIGHWFTNIILQTIHNHESILALQSAL